MGAGSMSCRLRSDSHDLFIDELGAFLREEEDSRLRRIFHNNMIVLNCSLLTVAHVVTP